MSYENTLLIDYLVSSVAHKVDVEAVKTILFDRGIEVDSTLDDVSREKRELCKADLFIWCSNAPSTRGTISDADGDWSHREGGDTLTNYERASLKQRARAIYRRYGELMMEQTIKCNARGMRLW